MAAYVPERGDLIWLAFSPQAGHEQAGRRPALVLSKRAFNRATRLALVCPVTSRVKGYPFEVPIAGNTIQGAVLADQARTVDWQARGAQRIEPAPAAVLDEVAQIVAQLASGQ